MSYQGGRKEADIVSYVLKKGQQTMDEANCEKLKSELE